MVIQYKHLRAIRPCFSSSSSSSSNTRYLHAAQPVSSRSGPARHALPTYSCRSGRLQNRGKKTKSFIKSAGLQQGVIPLEPLPLEDETPSYPTVVLQAQSNMRKFESCVLLTRVGGFYELYFEHADEYGPLMNLKVAQKRTNAGPVPMVCFSKIQLGIDQPHRPGSPSSSWTDI